jgi:hypothetical protein
MFAHFGSFFSTSDMRVDKALTDHFNSVIESFRLSRPLSESDILLWIVVTVSLM